jgi:phenylalanyl-tRNA synthetase alpha subunit
MSSSKGIIPPELIKDRGSLHPINHMKDSIMNLLISFGFEIVDGPEIETE